MSATKRLVVISDLHAGCRVGLCPTHGVTLDDGGQYFPSALQMKLWQMWRSFWDEFVPEATRGKPFDLVVNGDAIDGVHHGSTTQVSHNLADQLRIAHEILEPVVRRAENYYHVRGTEAHAGKSGATEEELARSLGAVTNRDGQSARFELWKRAGRHLVHVLHHLDGGGNAESTAIFRELVDTFTESARWGRRPPDVIVRSHRHRYIKVEIPTGLSKGAERGREPTPIAACVVTPGWQGKTPYAWKVAGARLQTPQFGGVVIDGSGDDVVVRGRVWTVGRTEAE